MPFFYSSVLNQKLLSMSADPVLKRHVTDDVFSVSPSVTPINRKEHHIKFPEFPKLSIHSFINTGVAGMIQGASVPLQNTAHIGVGTYL